MDLTFRRADFGAIVDETTAERIVKVDDFFVWRRGRVKDFGSRSIPPDGTNSGIPFRSIELGAIGEIGAEGLPGRFGFHGKNTSATSTTNTARSPNDQGRVPILSPRGQATHIIDEPRCRSARQRSAIQHPPSPAFMNVNGWNRSRIIARRAADASSSLNSRAGSSVPNEYKDTAHTVPEGILGFQIRAGPTVQNRVSQRDVSEALEPRISRQHKSGSCDDYLRHSTAYQRHAEVPLAVAANGSSHRLSAPASSDKTRIDDASGIKTCPD